MVRILAATDFSEEGKPVLDFTADMVRKCGGKMYLLHAMRFDSRLRVRSVTVTIDGEARVYEQGCPGFPFLYSMLRAKELKLPEKWREERFLRNVLNRPKSETDNDARYACLFSFLAGTGKVYESEKFTCYWTAVNALYNHVLESARPRYARSLGAERYEDLSRKKQVLSGDAVGIGALLRLTGSGQGLGSQSERNAHKPQYGKLKSLLRHIPREEFPALYRQLLAHRDDPDFLPEGPLGEHLRECCQRSGSTAWGFMTLDYAYYIRCNYLHGSKTTILFTAASDPELAAFRCLNVFLGEFLKEMIPLVFRENWFTGEQFRKVCPADQ